MKARDTSLLILQNSFSRHFFCIFFFYNNSYCTKAPLSLGSPHLAIIMCSTLEQMKIWLDINPISLGPLASVKVK